MKAVVVETHRWCTFQRLRTLAIEGVPGTFSVNLDDLEASMDRAMDEWHNHTEVCYSKTWYVLEDKIMKFKGDISHTTYKRPTTFNIDGAKEAIRLALQ